MSYRFGPFRVDPQREELWRGDRQVPLNRKAVQLLVALIERKGELLTKQELLSIVWPLGATMNNVSQHVFMLRNALEDSADEHQYILTVPRTGYRFVAPVEQTGSESPELVLARHYCTNARELLHMRTQPSIESAIALYERAIEQFEASAEAHAGLAMCRFLLGEYMFEPRQHMLRLAEADAQRALEIDPRNADAIVISAIATMNLRYAWSDAEQLLRSALRVDPKHLWAHAVLIEQYATRGDFEAARQALVHAESLGAKDDEAFPRLPLLRGLLHYYSGAFSAAIAELELLVAHYPRYMLARFMLGKALFANGELESAHAQVEEISRMGFDPFRPGQPNVQERAMTLDVLIRGAGGNRDAARAAVREFEKTMEGRPVSGVSYAICALGCGEPETALRYLQAAVANHEPLIGAISVDPAFNCLRTEPYWQKLLQLMNLASQS